jgi:hypothetical protein
MSCPHLEEVRMLLCRAYPVKKPVPVERVTTASCCDGESFRGCPLYREAVARAAGREDPNTGGDLSHVGPKGARP